MHSAKARFRLIALSLISLGLVAACGNKDDLYIPDIDDSKEQSQSKQNLKKLDSLNQ